VSRTILVAIALAAIAAWPVAFAHRPLAGAAAVAPAPAPTDFLQRDRIVAFYEREAARDAGDQIVRRTLAAQYLLRFRERGDLDDVARAQAVSLRSLQLQRAGNDAADMTMASALLAYHRFREALHYERDALAAVPSNDGARVQIASLQMELGRYDVAAHVLAQSVSPLPDPGRMAVRARYDELTGRLLLARNLIAEASTIVDRQYAAPAYTRSWYHFRAAQLAFESGDAAAVRSELNESLRLYPENAAALMLRAQWLRGQGRWQESLVAATQSAQLYPLPQTLGYEADAQRALGDAPAAARTDALIEAERRLYNVHGVNDRLLAMYDAQRHLHLAQALQMARADLLKRGDEIYADDTMAWVLASMHRWTAARTYALRATRLGTQDPMLQYHAGVIAMETGHRVEARRRLEAAVRANPAFDPFYAPDARRRLDALTRDRASLGAAQ